MRGIKIERLSVGDEDRLCTIRLRALRDAPEAFATTFADAHARPIESWREQLESLATFVAVADGLDVGVARGARQQERPGAAGLISMWVAPAVRGRGVGLALIDAVAVWARSEGLQWLILDVTEGNAAALALYARAGFRPTGHIGTLPPPRPPMSASIR